MMLAKQFKIAVELSNFDEVSDYYKEAGHIRHFQKGKPLSAVIFNDESMAFVFDDGDIIATSKTNACESLTEIIDELKQKKLARKLEKYIKDECIAHAFHEFSKIGCHSLTHDFFTDMKLIGNETTLGKKTVLIGFIDRSVHLFHKDKGAIIIKDTDTINLLALIEQAITNRDKNPMASEDEVFDTVAKSFTLLKDTI